jgi:hypothetical protein
MALAEGYLHLNLAALLFFRLPGTRGALLSIPPFWLWYIVDD